MTNKPGKEKAIQFNFDKMFRGFKKSRTVIYQITSTTTIKNCFKLLNSQLHRRLTVSSHWTHNLKCTYIRRSYVPYMNITITSSKHLMYVKFRSCKAQPGHPRISKMNRFPCYKALNLRCLWRSWLRPCRECTGLVLIHFLCPASNFLFKVNNSNTRKMCEICSKLTIKTPK